VRGGSLLARLRRPDVAADLVERRLAPDRLRTGAGSEH
jgi:hypothetical protein